MKLFLLKCLGITLLFCLNSIFLSAQTGPAGINSGTVLWLDASDVNAGGAAPAIGSTVSSWKDKSGSNHNATSSGTNTATYINGGANGTPVIHFNRSAATSGTGFTVNGLDIRATTSPVVTIFAVYRQGTNDGNNQAVWGNDNGSQQRVFNSKWNTGTTDGSLSTGGTAAVVAGASAVGETRLVTGIYSGQVTAGVNTGTSNGSAIYINGKKLSTFTDMTAASSGQSVFKIGSDGDDNYFNGDVSEIIVYNRKLTDCELETVNRYLADKYATDFINIGANYTLGVPVNSDINGVGRPVSACGGNYTIMTASSDIAMITNPSSSSTAGVMLTFANDRKGYASSSETPPAFSSRLTQRWRADLNGNIGTVDICFNLQNLGIDVSNSGNFALLIDKDGNFSDATAITSGVTIFIDRVCISNVSITKGDYFTLAIRASTSDASSITSPNKGIFQKANFRVATVIDNQIQVKGNDTITNGRAYIDTNFVSGDILGFTAGALPAGVTGAYNATTGALSFSGKATAAQWQTIFRTVTFRTTSTTDSITDRRIRFVLGNVISYTIGSTPHYYEYVTTPMNWVNAKAAAASRTLYGLQGYLATSTSQIENDFLKARLSADGWIGASCNLAQVNSVSGATQYGSQAAVDGHYYWITGPEAGQEISTGLVNPVAVGSAYTYWNGGEPNNYQGTSEQFVQLYSTNAGRWNDLPLSSLLGYVVEYGGYASDAVINIEYSRVVRSSPAAPVITGITTDSNIGTDRITNDPTLIFAGTSPNSAKVTILREDLGVIGNVTASNTGAWTFDYTGTTLTDGTYNFTAIDTVASVESAMSVIFQVTIDLTAPAKPATPALIAGGNRINTQRPTFTGSAEPGSTVTLYDGATARGSAKADSTGTWIITATTNMATGTRSVTVSATDIAGNVSVASDVFSVTIDLTVPAAPARPVLTGGTAGVISNSKPTITGTGAEANTTVLIIQDGVVVDSVVANASGAYTYTFANTLPDAVYSITVKDRDLAGNLSAASQPLSITVDTTPPATLPAPVLTGGNNGVINSHKPTITGTGAEPNSTVIIFKDGVAVDSVTANAGGAYTYTFVTSLPDAVYSITVKDKDAIGNVSAVSPALSLTVDTTVPVRPAAPILAGGNNGVISSHTPTITGVAEINSTVIIYKNGIILDSVSADAAGNYVYTFITPLPDATYSITIKDKDAAGNVSLMSPVLSLTVDTTVPAAPAAPVLVGGNNGVISDPQPTITGSAEANSTVIIYKDGVAIDSVITDITGDYTYTFNPLADGTYSITVKDKDAAGNVSASSSALSITVDTTAPATPAAPVLVGGINGLISDNTPTITGVAEANSTVLIYKDGIAVDVVTADAGGNYTYTFTTLADDTYSITVKDRDAAGNVSASSAALSITIDITAPATPDAPVLSGGHNGVISDNTPTIAGTAEANTTVIIYKDGVAVDSVTADTNGDYTYTFASLADGVYSITVKDKDAAGNVSAASAALNMTVDTTPPATPAVPVLVDGVNGVTGDPTPTIEGVAEANSTVIIYKDGVAVDSVTADTNGDYTYTFASLADGVYSITVKDKDAAGNISASSSALSITVDTTPPATPAAPVLVGGNSGVISDNTPTIKGVAEANGTVIIYKDGVAVDSVTADNNGDYTYTFTSLADGVYSITVRDKDAVGNISASSAALSITVDTTPPATPAAPVLVDGNNGVISDNTPAIKGVAEANSIVIIYKDGVAVDSVTADNNGDYTYTFGTALADGTYSITVKNKDAAGNVSASSSALSITVDTTPPATPVAPVLVGGNNGLINDSTPTIKGVAEANSTVIIYKDGVAVDSVTADNNGDYTYTFTSLADGVYSITVRDKDAVGNISASSAALSITVDTTPPATPAAPVLVGGNNGVINDNTPTIEGVAEANSTVIIFKGGVAIDSVVANGNGDYTYTFVTALADGIYNIKVKAKDAVGNVSAFSAALSITVDTNAPVTPAAPVLVGGNNGVISDNTPTIKGIAEANSTVIIYKDGVVVDSVAADANGNYTYTFNSLADGTYSIAVKNKDGAGNVSASSPALSMMVDTTAPATPGAPVLVGGVNGVTNDNTPTIKGIAEANNTVIIYKDGVAVDSVSSDVNGEYTYTFTSLADGTYSITVKDKDAAGNVSASSPALSITVDTTAPATPAAPVLVGGHDGVINDNTPTIEGMAEVNSTVIIYKDGVVLDSVIADATGAYTYTFVTALADGTYSITVKDKDAVGNVSAMSASLSIKVDTAAPATPTAPVLIGGTNNVTNDATPDIKGKAEANSTVTIYNDGVSVGTTTADASGNYTYTFTTDLADGAHAITVTATDKAGNLSASSPALNISVDSHGPATPPAPELIGGTNNVTTDPTPDIKGTAEANSTVTVYENGVKKGTTIANGSGAYTFNFLSELIDGAHAITVTATDATGNVSAVSPALNIVVDAHPPARPPAPVLLNSVDSVTNDPTPDIKGKAEAKTTITIYSDQVEVGTAKADANGIYTFTFTTDLMDGQHAITVTATDSAGNVSPVSPALNLLVDTHAPGRPTAPVLVGGNNGLINDATPDITGKAEPNSTVNIFVDGSAAGTAPVDASGNYSFTFPAAIPDGPHAITATATDKAGNTSENQSPALNIVIDTKPPSTPSTPILIDGVNGVIKTTKPTVTGTVEPNTTVTIYDGDVAVGTTTADNTGKWIYTFDPAISNGAHIVTVTATDAAGNISAKSAELPITVDAHVPDVPMPPRLPGVNGFVNTTTPAITGQGEPGTLITIYTDGTKSGTVLVDANGNWTYTYNPPLLESVHNINVTASEPDGANESGHSETVKLTIDLVGPTVKVTSSTTSGVVVNGTVSVTVTFSEGVSGFSWDDVKVTNGKVSGFTQVSSGIYQVLITPTSNGTVTVSIPAGSGFDIIGNGNAESALLSMSMKPAVGIDQVYPMPAADVINIRLSGVDDEQAVVKMTNMAGQVLLHQQNVIKEGILKMNVTRLPSGTYVLLVVLQKGSYNTTVVIAR